MYSWILYRRLYDESTNYNNILDLVFRDFLRVHPNIARKYGDLKEALAEQYPYDMDAYINGKDKLAKEIEQQAVYWCKSIS